jgi:hypothetical protein
MPKKIWKKIGKKFGKNLHRQASYSHSRNDFPHAMAQPFNPAAACQDPSRCHPTKIENGTKFVIRPQQQQQ